MVEVIPVPEKNYIIFRPLGDLTVTDIESGGRKMKDAVSKMQGKFVLLSDLREVQSIPADGREKITQYMKMARENGMDQVIRVFRSKTMALVSKFVDTNIKAGYFTTYFTDWDKAMAHLEKTIKNY
jgi:hypothetical protein